MARPLRVEYPDTYYHIISRGTAGENIFIESVCDEFEYREEQVKMRGLNDNKALSQLQFILPDTLAGYHVRILGHFSMVYQVRQLP